MEIQKSSYPTEEMLVGYVEESQAPRQLILVLLGWDLYDVREGWKAPETGLMLEPRGE